MTLQQVKEEIPSIQRFLTEVCINCMGNDWYCPSYCELLDKAQKIPLIKIQQAYVRHNGDLKKVLRYIKNFNLEKNGKTRFKTALLRINKKNSAGEKICSELIK